MKKVGMGLGQCIDINIYGIVATGLSHETMCLYKLLLNVVHF